MALVLVVTGLVFWVVRFALKKMVCPPISWIAAVVMAVLLACVERVLISPFQIIFKDFYTDLPMQIQALMDLRYALWLPLLCLVLAGVRNQLRGLNARWYTGVFAVQVLVLACVVYALYAPIFKLC